MDKKMFCFQCEQTVGCAGCTGNAGVCGKLFSSVPFACWHSNSRYSFGFPATTGK